jgi:hypothetical protein
MKFILLFFAFTFILYNSFSQTKKEKIVILNQMIDSLNISNKHLFFEIDRLNSSISDKNKQIEACSKETMTILNKYNNLKINKQEDSINFEIQKEKYIKQIEVLKDSLTGGNKKISNWLNRNLNINIPINSNNLKINRDLTEEIKIILFESEQWLGAKQVNEYKDNEFFISINLGDDNYNKRLLMNENFLVISYHLQAGSNGGSILIDLNKMDVQYQSFYALDMERNNTLKVVTDYYDNNGHVWEYGRYFIENESYKFLYKEH